MKVLLPKKKNGARAQFLSQLREEGKYRKTVFFFTLISDLHTETRKKKKKADNCSVRNTVVFYESTKQRAQ